MTTHSDFLIGRIALERGLLSVEQLAECLNDQRGAPASPLGAIMLRKGLIRQGELDSLIDEHKRRLADALELSDPKLEDALLGRLLIKQGLVKEAQLYECLRASAEVAEKGEKAPRLGELLVRKGFLSTDAVDRLVFPPARKEGGLYCPACKAHFSTVGADPGKKVACKQCGGPLERPEKQGDTTESISKVDLPEDVAAVAKDPVRQFAGGKYILVQEVGRGGMGVVWKAWQPDLKRYVAIKILVGTMWSDVELKRFYREAQMAASLSHPNIASIYEVGAHEGKHYISMEFVDGDSLARLMAPAVHKQGTARVKALAPRRAIEILRETALAADYAHSKKIIHRDLKPHNIMVQRADGRVYVMDFGLAKPIRAQDSITMSDAIVGTPQYMSPEQARGDAIDRRADVYALGAVLYHVLAGKPPFEGHSPAEVMMSVLADDPVPIRRLNHRIHADVETICLKALDKDRDRRYDSARSLADDLGRYLEGEPISARPLSRRQRLWKEARRRPFLAAVTVAALAAGVLLAAIFGTMSFLTGLKVEKFLEDARAANRAGDYADARDYCARALGLDPGNEDALRERDIADERLSAKEAQAREEERRREQDKKQAHSDAETLFKASLFYDAGLKYEYILGLDRNDTLAQQRKRECEAALARQRQNVEKLEDEFEALTRERKVQLERELKAKQARYAAQGDYEKAREAEVAAASIRLFTDGLTIADVVEKLREAREALGRSLDKDPTYAEAYLFRGQIKHKMGDYALAELDFKEAVKYSSDTGPAAYGAAMTQLALYMLATYTPYVVDEKPKIIDPQARDDALQRLRPWANQAASPDNKNEFQRWCAKALIEFHNAQYTKAEETLKPIERDGKFSYFYHFLLGAIHMERREYRVANQEFTVAIDKRPTSLEALFLRAVSKMETQDLAGALDDANRAVEAVPKDAPVTYRAYLLRAHLHHQLNDATKAREDLQSALTQVRPGTPVYPQILSLMTAWSRTGPNK
jgi:tetratricopeptide (TPR) repeat protein